MKQTEKKTPEREGWRRKRGCNNLKEGGRGERAICKQMEIGGEIRSNYER